MSAFRAPWALCGGWAVDAWLGRETRDHPDVDFLVFDQQALFDYLDGWQLVAHHPNVAGDANELWDGQPMDLPAHIHGRLDMGEPLPDRVDLAAEQGFRLDIQLNERSGDRWIMSREPRIGLPLDDAVRQSSWGVPTVVPEVLLLYKARGFIRRRDQLDFLALRTHLTDEQRDWLRNTISLVGHPWLGQLSR